ncbi:unnamed protein product [Durusdinium trenchii]|uniref:Uncharacterized protein n=2 Tax=Durusdinium trenchii TaxID=1381693 RepID=A0ABP0PSK9_9DINO
MENAAVLEAFKKFDKDGDGSITRDELGNVLRTLDPEEWTEQELDRLLGRVDANGDGKLQVEEFLRWIFAEDGQFGEFGNTFQSIIIQGSSRDDLNGEYIQQDDFYGGRPVFYNAEKGKYLFFNRKHQRWQIFVRTSWKASARLYTKRAPHLASEELAWHVYTGGKFVEEPSMAAVLAPSDESDEQKCAKAAEAVYIKTRWSNVTGGYVKTEKTNYDRPAYYNEEGNTWLLYDGRAREWKVSSQYSTRHGKLVSSLTTEVFSPELTDWKGSTTAVRVDPKRREADYSQGGWIDDAFPHTQESIGNSRQCEWVRARDLAEKPALFDDIEPADVCQGALGDCWLIAAIAGAAEFPNFFRDHLFETKEINEDGKYRIRLYDWIKKKWTVIEIDDYIPCKPRKWYEPVASTIFSEVCNEQLYVVLMEKAFAKFAGSYQALNGGFSFLAWMAMTGETDVIGWWRQRHQPKWDVTGSRGLIVRAGCDLQSEKLGRLSYGAVFEEVEKFGYRIHFKKLEGEGPEEGWLSCYIGGYQVAKCRSPAEWKQMEVNYAREKISFGTLRTSSVQDRKDREGMWKKMQEYDRANFLMGASIHTDRHEREHRREDGLVEAHAYSVIHAAELNGVQLICCRNPWGNKMEWNGPWCDQSDEWSAHPEIAEALGVDEKADGLFWMDWESFEQTFTMVEICPKAMPAERASFHK